MPSRLRQQRGKSLRRDASEVADRFSEALRSLFCGGCVAHDAPPARALRHRLQTEVRGRASNLSRPTVSSVGKSGSHGASWLAQRVRMNVTRRSSQNTRARWLSDRSNVRRLRRATTSANVYAPDPTNLTNAKKYFEQRLAVGDYYAESERVVGQLDRQRRGVARPSRRRCSTRLRSLCENNEPRTGTRLTQRLKTTRTVDDGPDNEHQAANQSVLYDFAFSLHRNRSQSPSQSPHARAVFSCQTNTVWPSSSACWSLY